MGESFFRLHVYTRCIRSYEYETFRILQNTQGGNATRTYLGMHLNCLKTCYLLTETSPCHLCSGRVRLVEVKPYKSYSSSFPQPGIT